MNRVSHWLALPYSFCWAVLLCGCGGALQVTAPVAPLSTGTLAGNWLLYGALPYFVTSAAGPQGLVVDFDVEGNTIVGSASGQTTCSSGEAFGYGFGYLLRGTIATDGSFTVSSPANSGVPLSPVLTIQGTIPKAVGAPWTGTYTLVNSGSSSAPGAGCTVNQSAPFMASSVADVTGTYTGAGTLNAPTVSKTGLPLILTAILQQGAPLYTANPTVTPISSRLGLSGSLQVQGVPCFSTGASSTSTASYVEGNEIAISFTMDDGSTVLLLGSIGDTSSASLSIGVLEIKEGKCSGLYSLGLRPIVIHR